LYIISISRYKRRYFGNRFWYIE